MLLISVLAGLLGVLVKGDAPVKGSKDPKSLTPVRPLPCHSLTMIKDTRPTEFLFIAPGNSGDCSFIFEGVEEGRLDIKVRNLKSNLPRGNGDPCEDGQVRLYNYKGSGEITLSQRLCDNEKEVTMLTDTNMAIVASSLIDGSFSIVARSVSEPDLLVGNDIDQLLTPPKPSKHDWSTKSTSDDNQRNEDDEMEENEKEDTQTEDYEESTTENQEEIDLEEGEESTEIVKEPSRDETPPSEDSFVPNYFVDTNITNTNHTMNNCSYNMYGYYVCHNQTNSTNTNHTGYHYYDPSPTYHDPYIPYEPKPIYSPPYEAYPTYEAPKPVYSPPNPLYSPPNHLYSPPSSVYSPPLSVYTAPESIYSSDIYSHSDTSYKAPHHEYSSQYHHETPIHEKPFRPSQPIPNDWEEYYKPSNFYREPVWYDEKGPYPGNPTKYVDLTHDTYPMYPSYYNPGYYDKNSSHTTPPSLTSTTEAPGKRTTMNKPTTKGKSTPKPKPKPTTKKPSTMKPTSTTKHHHSIFGVKVPWTANVTITSGDNLADIPEKQEENPSPETTQRIKLNRIINNLPSAKKL